MGKTSSLLSRLSFCVCSRLSIVLRLLSRPFRDSLPHSFSSPLIPSACRHVRHPFSFRLRMSCFLQVSIGASFLMRWQHVLSCFQLSECFAFTTSSPLPPLLIAPLMTFLLVLRRHPYMPCFPFTDSSAKNEAWLSLRLPLDFLSVLCPTLGSNKLLYIVGRSSRNTML